MALPGFEFKRTINLLQLLFLLTSSCYSLQWPTFLPVRRSGRSIDLGPVDEVAKLFSYPNHHCPVIHSPHRQRLEDTVEHYLRQSLLRQTATTSTPPQPASLTPPFRVFRRFGRIRLRLPRTPESQKQATALAQFLSLGQTAYNASQAVHADGKWEYNWRFLLPLGVPLPPPPGSVVQLLHFPPDYVLLRDQDHYSSRTIRRWQRILEWNTQNNTIAPPPQQIILDLVPIAAPATDGPRLSSVYEYYNDYRWELLRLYTEQGRSPVVAFGAPVRRWIQEQQPPTSSSRQRFWNVLDLVPLRIPTNTTTTTPVLIANHPSYFYRALQNMSPEKRRQVLVQDLIVGRWQVQMMSKQRGRRRRTTTHEQAQSELRAAKRYWKERPELVQEILEYEQLWAK